MKIEKRIVNKERGIVQITCPDERWYQIRPDDEKKPLTQDDFYPSVTWIGSFYPKTIRYMKWLAEKGWDKAEEVKNLAAEKGSRVHRACNDLLLGEEVKMDSKYSDSEGEVKELSAEEYGIIMSFKEWLDEEQPQVLGTEYTILNHWQKFGGTVDFKCKLKSDGYKAIWIVDIKTSQDIWPSHEIQVSAYLKTELDAQKCAILQVGYNRNKIKKYKFSEIVPQFDLFLAAKAIWKKESEGTLVPQREYPLFLKWIKQNPPTTSAQLTPPVPATLRPRRKLKVGIKVKKIKKSK